MAAVTAEIALEISKLKAGIDKALAEVKQFKAAAKAQGGGLGESLFGGLKAAAATSALAAGAAITAAMVGTAAGLKNAFDLGGELTDLAAQIGSTAGKAQVLNQAFNNSGLEGVQATVNKLQKSMADAAAGGKSSGIFKDLKLDIAELMAMDPADAFAMVGGAIAKIDDPTKRAAASMEVFGKSGGKLLSLFGDSGALAFAAEQLGAQSGILDKSAGDFDRASDILGGASRKIQGFFVGLGSQVVGAIMPMLDELNKLDLAGMGERFGKEIVNAMNFMKAAWQELNFAEAAALMGTAMEIGISEAINVLYKGFMASLSAFGQLLLENIKNAVTLLQIVTTKDFWSGMLKALVGIAQTFNSIIFGVIAAILETIKKLPGGESLVGGGDQFMRDMSAQSGRDAADSFGAAGADLAPAMDAIIQRTIDQAVNIAKAFQDSFAGTENIFDTSDEMAKLQEAMQRIRERAEQIGAEAKDAAPVAAAAKKGDGTKTEATPLDRSPGLFASALNVLLGRSAAEISVEEAKRGNAILEEIAKNTRPKGTTTNVTEGDSALRFA